MFSLTQTELFSIILNILLFIWGVAQLIYSRKEAEKVRGKVRVWHKSVEGIKNALLQIGQNPQGFTNKEDISASIQAVAQNAVSLDDSFAEDRFYKDDEIKARREKNEKEAKEFFKKLRRLEPVSASPSASKPIGIRQK